MNLRWTDGAGTGSENTRKEKADSKKARSKKAKPSPATTPPLICIVAETMASPRETHPLMPSYTTFRQGTRGQQRS